MKPQVITLASVLLASACNASAGTYKVESPSGRLTVIVTDDIGLEYSVELHGQTILAFSPIGISFLHENSQSNQRKVISTAEQSISETIIPAVPVKRRAIVDAYNELHLQLSDQIAVIFRAYDEGIAYRWCTTFSEKVTVADETATFRFPEDGQVWFARESSTFTSQEEPYEQILLSSIGPDSFASAPVLVGLQGERKVLITEADLCDYPGMFLQGAKSSSALLGKFAGYPLETREDGYRHIKVAKHADYLAKTSGDRSYPWRVLLISEEDRQLVDSDLVYKLSPACKIKHTSWIKPGKVVWDWWHARNIPDVDFEAGINTKTYKHYIDFAAENGIEYVLIDEGWSKSSDLLSINPEMDLPEIMRYAKEKNVDVILWVVWKTLDRQMHEALDYFNMLGVAGIKVDFMSRDDQQMVNFYHRVAREAALRHLVVDFHGSYKPTGLRRAYPNVLTRESVRGLEYCKWSDSVTPKNNVILPFIRMVAGPLDYTPGAMKNALGSDFKVSFDSPSSRSTRCHQLAMYVVYESPLQMLADSPSNYRKELACLEFIKATPTIWDETRVLFGEVGDHVVIARRSGQRWFLGGMAGENATHIDLKLDFLPEGTFKLKAWQDGGNAHRNAEDYRILESQVSSLSMVPVRMAPGGGWAAIIEQVANKSPRIAKDQ